MNLGSLAGIKVLECCHFIAGPRCVQLLADHGAEVVKLEPPQGDYSRRSAPKAHGWSLYFAAHNRGKKSVVVDLKRPESRAILDRLIGWADVIVTNYTPGATERLGLDLANARRINPRVVVVRISAYGLTGENRDVPGYDGTIQARSGLAHMIGPPDRPPTIGSVPLIDFMAAVEGAYGATLGLRRRELTGEGCEVDVSLMDTASTVLGYLYAEVLVSGREPMRTGSMAPYALTGGYEAADGYVYLAPIGNPAWSGLCHLIGRPEWAAEGAEYLDPDARLRDRAIIEAAINAWTSGVPRDQLTGIMREAGVPCDVVSSVSEAAQSPAMRGRDMLLDVHLGVGGPAVPMPGVEVKINGEPDLCEPAVPALGANTREVLGDLGFDDEQIDKWQASGVAT